MQSQLRPRAPGASGVHCLPLDRIPGVREIVHDRLHQVRQMLGHPVAVVFVKCGQGELANEVVDVRLRSDEQVGRHVSEGDLEPGLERRQLIGQPGQSRILEDVLKLARVRRGLQLRPDDLAAAVRIAIDTPARCYRLDQSQAPARHVRRAEDRSHGRTGVAVTNGDPNPLGVCRHRDHQRGRAMLYRVGEQFSRDKGGIVAHRPGAEGVDDLLDVSAASPNRDSTSRGIQVEP